MQLGAKISLNGVRASFGVRPFAIAAGDFDEDGWTDLAALVDDPLCHVHFLKNLNDGTDIGLLRLRSRCVDAGDLSGRLCPGHPGV
ncbi:MAG: hypothetical protein R3C68_15585 [Myxococcota bacterium]